MLAVGRIFATVCYVIGVYALGLSGVSSAAWWTAILGQLHAPLDPTNASNLDAWQACEGGTAAFNPFNTTEPWPGSSDYNSAGVKNYPNFNAGVLATVATLENGLYGSIISALKSSAPRSVFASAVGNSPWGTSGACIDSASGGGTGGGGLPPPPPVPSPPTAAIRQASVDTASAIRYLVDISARLGVIGCNGWRP